MEDKKENEVKISKDGLKTDGTELHFGDSTLQTPEEHTEDENTDPEKNNDITLGND